MPGSKTDEALGRAIASGFFIRNLNLCFAFVDGIHTPDGCMSDVFVCEEAIKKGIIVLDDIRNVYGTQPYAHLLWAAVNKSKHLGGWEHFPSPDNWQHTILNK